MTLLFRSILICFLGLASTATLATADHPSPRQKNFDWMALHNWYELHAEDVREAYKGEAELVFLGDSITQGWDMTLWQEYFVPYKAVNFGIGGDLTQNLLWRLQNGAAGNLQPRLVILMIGVNNFGHENASAKEVHKGVEAIVTEIEQRFPLAQIVLLGILPYGEKTELADRSRVRAANVLLEKLAEQKNLIFRDYGDLFLQEDAAIPRELMPDLLHPNAYGYALLAEQLIPLVKEHLPSNPLVSTLHENILVEGRQQISNEGQMLVGYPGVSLHLKYHGEALTLNASSSNGNNLVDVYVNGKLSDTLKIAKQPRSYVLANADQPETFNIELVHRSETWHGVLNLEGFKLYGGKLLNPTPLPQRKLLFIGDSVTCGEALLREKSCDKNFSWWDPEHAYGKLLGEMLNAQTHLVCYGGRGLLRSWNGSTDEQQAPNFFQTSVPLGAASPVWDHSHYNPDLIFISLGTNDFNLNIGPFPQREEYVSRYLEFINDIQQLHPDSKIVITEGPIVNDKTDPEKQQKTVLQNYLKEVQQNSKGEVIYLPSKVYGGDACDAHPTAKQHQKMAKDLRPEVKKLMGW